MITPEEQPRNREAAAPGAGPGGAPPVAQPKRRIPPVEYQFKPGQSGNPGGRPKGTSITAALRAALSKEHGGKTLAELIADRFIKEALSGKFPFAKEVLERADGKVPDKQDLTLKGGAAALVGLAAGLSDDDLIDAAAQAGLLHELPPRLKGLAIERGLDVGAGERP